MNVLDLFLIPRKYQRERCFEVNIRIRNDAYEKKVCVVWSDDDWRTSNKVR